MADASEPFLLCKTLQRNSLLGIEEHCDRNHVILTFKDRGVLVYNLENNKLVHSLPVQQRKEFTSAVVQDPTSRRYIGIVEKLNICQWSESGEDLADCHQIKVEQPVFKVLVSSACLLEPVVVFQDGSSHLLSNCINIATPRKKRGKTTATALRILSCSLLKYKNISVVFVAKIKEKHLVISVSKLVTDEEALSTREWMIDVPSEDEELISCCFQESESFNLVSFWSKGSLCTTDLKDVLESLSHPEAPKQNILTCICINRINRETSKHKKPVVMSTMDSSHVCLSFEINGKSGTQDSINIYETKFGTKQASITLEKLKPDEADGNPTGGSSGTEHILCLDGYICVGVQQCVAACSCRVKESSLATALGKMTWDARPAEMTSARPLLCIPQLPEPSTDLKDWMDEMKTEQSTEEAVLRKLTNPKKIKSLEEFTTEVRQYLDSKHPEGKDNPVGCVKKSSFKAKDKLKDKYLLSQHFVLSVLSRCLEETHFWPKEALSYLIQTQCIPGSASPDLLKRLTEEKDTDMISKCFNSIKGIPESSLVSCLQYVLEASDSVFGDEPCKDVDSNSTESTEEEPDNGCQFGEKRSNLLCRLLGYPVNDVFVQNCIKKLDSSHVMTLMNFLVHIVKSAPMTSFVRKDSQLDYPTALDWIGWIINAHYAALILNSNFHGLLVDLHDSVENQVTLFEILGRVEGFLVQYKSKHPLPAKKNVGLYTVEMLEL